MRYNLRLHDLPAFVRVEIPSTSNMPSHAKRAQKHDGKAWQSPQLAHFATWKVCKNVEVKPHLLPLGNERFNIRSANTSLEARLDMNEDGFWLREATAFFYVRVTQVNSKCNQASQLRWFSSSMRTKRRRSISKGCYRC